MNCYNCDYGHRVYDKKGMVLGVECAHDNMRYLPDQHIRLFCNHCPNWTEADIHDR